MENNLLMATLRAQTILRYKQIMEQREEILSAFIAKHGCGPDEVVQVTQQMPNGSMRWSVEKK